MRVTFDTNQLVRALMHPPQLATLMMAWEARRFQVVASPELLDEYDRVLLAPDVASLIYPQLLRVFRHQLWQEIEVVAILEIPRVCRDPDDDMVLATALYGEIDYLVTADGDLRTPEVLTLLRDVGIDVLTIDDLVLLLDREPNR
jgi:uncharacterized protein